MSLPYAALRPSTRVRRDFILTPCSAEAARQEWTSCRLFQHDRRRSQRKHCVEEVVGLDGRAFARARCGRHIARIPWRHAAIR